jgi:2,4-dienoyl-CoA reductase-like NADH-dependent reductase (Old Yellow Enzyme family)
LHLSNTAGLIIVEATGVQPNGRITPHCLGLWSDEQLDGHARLVNVFRSQQAVAGIQLAHSGRKGSTPPPFSDLRTKVRAEKEDGGWPDDVVGPSPIAWSDGWYVPRELTLDDIEVLKQDWVKAAQRADKVGYEYLEIHAAHG